MELARRYCDLLTLDVTNRCNLRCRHCFNYSGEHRSERTEHTDDELIDAAKQIADIRPNTTCLCGGEPLLRKELVYELIRIIKKGGGTVNMVSNGSLLDGECADNLKKSGVGNVQISLDGDRESHNWLRNDERSYDSAISAIENLIDAKVETAVSCTPNVMNINKFDDLANTLTKMGVSRLRVQPIMGLGRAKNIQDYFPSTAQYMKLSLSFANKRVSREGEILIEWVDPNKHLQTLQSGTIIKNLMINSYGDIMISPYVPVSFGNVRNHSIAEYIESGIFEVPKSNVIQKLFKTVYSNMDLVESKDSLPELYKDELFRIDVIDDSLADKYEALSQLLGC